MKLIFILLLIFGCYGQESVVSEDKKTTELSYVFDERPLVLATLGGGMVALEPLQGNILWKLKDEPAVKVPSQEAGLMPQFLPDPRHGFLYMYGPRGDQQVLKKLPFTIPELVANAPCRSSEGIFYTGKKSDTWFMLDPLTGSREHVSGFDKQHVFGGPRRACADARGVYVARTEYNILMHDSADGHRRWNVTFFDYTSHDMGKDMLSDYGIIHFASTSSGRVMSFDRKTGDLVWSHNLESPVVAAYLLDRDGLISVPFNSIGDDTLDHIMEDASTLRNGQGIKNSNIELFPTLYIGEHHHGLYALSSLVDKNTITISTGHAHPLLLEGPSDNRLLTNSYEPYKNVHYKLHDINLHVAAPYLLLGHYKVPELTTSWTPQVPNKVYGSREMGQGEVRLINGQVHSDKNDMDGQVHSDKSYVENETNMKAHLVSVSVQTEEAPGLRERYRQARAFLNQQENKVLKLALIILVGLVITMFWYLRYQAREFQQLSQGSSHSSRGEVVDPRDVTARPERAADGSVRVGRIAFRTDQVLGKGCEGTFVFRGTFDQRPVAVKRLLPECFTFADREVALLRESDAHAHVVRYYCTERDQQFRYIALELCSATLQDYVEQRLGFPCPAPPAELLRQATLGLAHLHSMNIVHRDVKPHNVLLSVGGAAPGDGAAPGGGGAAPGGVRALISDFGLSKKLSTGRASLSRRSGVTGTDGWIAAEIMRGERTTMAVDIFSLGCVFYYVLSRGAHAFGDALRRQANILAGEYDLDQLDTTMPPEDAILAKMVIRAMLSPAPAARPPAAAVLQHPVFWSKQTVLNYLQDVSDHAESAAAAAAALDVRPRAALGGDWRARLCAGVARDLRARRTYRGDSVAHLLRAVRNKKHHYRELDAAVRASLGPLPDGFVAYWLGRFPLLLPHVWLALQHAPDLQQYYHAHAYRRDDTPELDDEPATTETLEEDTWNATSKWDEAPRKRSEGKERFHKKKRKEEPPVWTMLPQ